ncbi:MAG: type II toxin-antitoxin system VapC family toxin [Chloroflexota bacterium]
MSLILDTDHCVAILRGRLDVGVHVGPTAPLFVTAITVSELVYGAHKSNRSEHHLAQVDLLLDGVSVLPFDREAAWYCGQLKDTLRRAGAPLSEPDLQIASLALCHTLPLATHNQRHFARVPGLSLVDWLAPKTSEVSQTSEVF